MKRKGFTLIELLAVIVVLAIIALIATPIVMNVIKKANEGAAERSADNYVKAVETLIATEKLDGTPLVDGTYTIESDGTLKGNGETYTVEVSGTKPVNGTITIENGQVVKDDTTTIEYKDYTVKFEDGVANAGDREAVKDAAYYGLSYQVLNWYGEENGTYFFSIDQSKMPEGYYDRLIEIEESFNGAANEHYYELQRQFINDYKDYLLEISNFVLNNYKVYGFNDTADSFIIELKPNYGTNVGIGDHTNIHVYKQNDGNIGFEMGCCYC